MKSYKEMADDILERRDKYEMRKKSGIKLAAVFVSVVACLSLVTVLGVDIFAQKEPISLASGQNSGGQQSRPIASSGLENDVFIPYIFLNEMEDIPLASGSRLYFSPDEYDFEELSNTEIKDYFKREIVPMGLVREPLKEKEEISCTLITEKKSGKIALDIAYVQYANKFYEDGSPVHPSEDGAYLTIYASRLSKPNIDYDWAGGKFTELKGVKVYAGKTEVAYNYNEQKEPTAFYTTYFAEFKVDGIYYEVTADNLSVEEFSKAVWGIIAY